MSNDEGSDFEGDFYDTIEDDESMQSVEDAVEQNVEASGNKTSEEIEKQKAARLEQKQKGQERRLAKPHSEIILEAKKIWEELRQKQLSPKDRKSLMNDMMDIVRGKALDIIYKHDASRIIQCCIKYGSPAQRDEVAHELSGHYAKLCQSKYGRFIVSKILQYCSPKCRSAVITDFYGKVRKLIRHKEASLVLDEAYSQYANAAQRTNLMEEFYGPEFAIFKNSGGPRTLKDLVDSDPHKKQYVLKYTREAIDSVLEKANFNVGKTPILHRAILDYLNVADHAVCKDMMELLKDHLVHMLHTREGARVAQYCILHSGPKDRKYIVKTFKTFVHSIAKEQYGHAVLLTCFECIDDTVLVGKALIGELFNPASQEHLMSELLRDQYGSRVILFLLSGRNKHYQPAYLVNELAETDLIRAETTKKEPEARHKQLLEVVSPLLIAEVALYAEELLRSKAGGSVILETCNRAFGDVSPVIDAVLASLQIGASLEVIEGSLIEPSNAVKKLKAEKDLQTKRDQGLNMDESVLLGRFSTFTVKAMLMKVKEGEAAISWKADFSRRVWNTLQTEFIKLVYHCASNPSNTAGLSFILVALFENGESETQEAMKKALVKDKKSISKALESAMKELPTPDLKDKKRKRGEPRSSAQTILLSLVL